LVIPFDAGSQTSDGAIGDRVVGIMRKHALIDQFPDHRGDDLGVLPIAFAVVLVLDLGDREFAAEVSQDEGAIGVNFDPALIEFGAKVVAIAALVGANFPVGANIGGVPVAIDVHDGKETQAMLKAMLIGVNLAMSYSNFRLAELVDQFELNLKDRTDLFAGIPEIEPSDRCKLDLKNNVPLAIAMNTEKARSGLIILAVLLNSLYRLIHTLLRTH